MKADPIVIVSAKRTPMGQFLGELAHFSSPQLAGFALRAILEQTGLSPEHIDEVVMGCVLSAGIGQAPARQAAHFAHLPRSIPATTINKMCGSGLKAVMLAYDALLCEPDKIIMAGGMESMSQAPYLMKKARTGFRFGHEKIIDHLLFDGLEDAYDPGKAMGWFADECARQHGISREEQDTFAIRSYQRALDAEKKGAFHDERVPIANDEPLARVNFDKIPRLKPVFQREGTVTAANASSIADGDAALLLMRQSRASALQLTPMARLLGHISHAQMPSEFPLAPIACLEKMVAKVKWSFDEVDCFEINEAFAVVPLLAMHALNLPAEKVNIRGGACALGHPIGASGARILVTLLHTLQQTQRSRGVACLCIGGGEAVAVAVERMI